MKLKPFDPDRAPVDGDMVFLGKGEPRRGDPVIVFRGGYAALKRFGEPDPPGHPDD